MPRSNILKGKLTRSVLLILWQTSNLVKISFYLLLLPQEFWYLWRICNFSNNVISHLIHFCYCWDFSADLKAQNQILNVKKLCEAKVSKVSTFCFGYSIMCQGSYPHFTNQSVQQQFAAKNQSKLNILKSCFYFFLLQYSGYNSPNHIKLLPNSILQHCPLQLSFKRK